MTERQSLGRYLRHVGELPSTLELVLGNQISIAKEGLHPGLRNGLLRSAAFQNPEFYKAQAMRLSTYNKPRVVACAEDLPHHIGLPRGCLDDVRKLLTELGVRVVIRDERHGGSPARKDGHDPIIFMQCGPVRHQVSARAQAASRPFEHFVLVQPTAFQPTRNPNPDRRVEFQTLYQELVDDQTRTRRICEDVVDSVRNGRSPLILTERNEHLDRFERELASRVTWSSCAPD